MEIQHAWPAYIVLFIFYFFIINFILFLDRKSGETNIFIAYNRLISHPSGCMILKVADVSDVSKVAVVSDVSVMF